MDMVDESEFVTAISPVSKELSIGANGNCATAFNSGEQLPCVFSNAMALSHLFCPQLNWVLTLYHLHLVQSHILKVNVLIVNSSRGWSDPVGELARLRDGMHLVNDKGAIFIRGEPMAMVLSPFILGDHFTFRTYSLAG